MKTVTLTFSIVIHAEQKTVFNYISNWEKQSDWILFTAVKALSQTNQQQDCNLLAVTKFGPLKLVDTMVVIGWKPYERIVIEHTGRVVLGKGIFAVDKISDDSSKFMWQEITPVPLGIIGQVGFLLFKPFVRLPFMISLRKLKANIEAM